jgi:hypothetical protein
LPKDHELLVALQQEEELLDDRSKPSVRTARYRSWSSR